MNVNDELVDKIANLARLKFNSDENEKGAGQEDTLVTKEELEKYKASLHKTFGRLFLQRPG